MNDETTDSTELSPARVAELLREGEVELIDIRRDYEWEQSRIPGARLIEINDVAEATDSMPRDRPIVFYCRVGNRSDMPAAAFRQAGWDAHHLAGGIEAWAAEGLALEPEGATVAATRPPVA
jgi:rhodanese-related sulfurtransferase